MLLAAVPEDQFETKLDQVVEQLLGAAPTAARLSKQLINQAAELSLDSFMDPYMKAKRECVDSPDMKEAQSALREKRAPRF